MWEAIALSFALAMDSTAVAAARGLIGHHRRELVILPLFFGGFQAGMASLGWLGGAWVGAYISGWDTWVASALLVVIGGKMIVDALRGEPEPADELPPGTLGVYVGLAFATSIDAAAAGLTLPALEVDPAISVTLIGTITAACSAIGYLAGRAIGGKLGSRLGAVGGVVLIALGIQILARGL